MIHAIHISQRPLVRHYCTGTAAVVWIVDSSDVDRLLEAKAELHELLKAPELKEVPLLVVANKQDLVSAKSGDFISKSCSWKA